MELGTNIEQQKDQEIPGIISCCYSVGMIVTTFLYYVSRSECILYFTVDDVLWMDDLQALLVSANTQILTIEQMHTLSFFFYFDSVMGEGALANISER